MANAPKPDPTNASDLRETLGCIFAVVYTLTLLVLCVSTPFYVAAHYHPALGAVVALIAIPAWIYLGPPAMPGLVNGIVCVQGLLALVVIFLICVVKAIRLWFA